jgi:hypothetical protein
MLGLVWNGAARGNDQSPQLDRLRSEFRDALEAEIRAIRSGGGGNTIALRQGRRVLHGAGLHRYEFQLDFPQRLPSDAPANLVVEGRAPVKVTVGQGKGLAVTLVSPEDLGHAVPRRRSRTTTTSSSPTRSAGWSWIDRRC